MTISTTTNRVTYTGNGATTAFAFSYPFFADADLVVIETIIATGVQTTKTLTTHYTISGTTDSLGHYSSGGTVTAVTAPASTVTWTIYRDPSAVQSTDLVENDPMPAESLEAALDYQTMLNQRTRDIAARSLQQPEGDSATIDRLPAKVDRASKYLAFDADGDPVATAGTTPAFVVSTFAETYLDDANAGATRATLGAVGLTGNETIAGVKTFSSAIPGPTFSGTTTVEGLIDASGASAGQIKFPASQNASANENTLDDYEEGTWTPSVGGTATYTSQTGHYTKIGNTVHVWGHLFIGTIGTGSTTTISGLPFTAAAIIQPVGAVAFGGVAVNTISVLGVVDAGATTLRLYSTSTTGSGVGNNAVFGNSTSVYFSVTYRSA